MEEKDILHRIARGGYAKIQDQRDVYDFIVHALAEQGYTQSDINTVTGLLKMLGTTKRCLS